MNVSLGLQKAAGIVSFASPGLPPPLPDFTEPLNLASGVKGSEGIQTPGCPQTQTERTTGSGQGGWDSGLRFQERLEAF